MDRDRAPQDPSPDHHNVTIGGASHMSSFAFPGRGGCARGRPVWVAADVRAWGDRPPEEVAVRPYRKPGATAILKVPGQRPGSTGARRFPWDAVYEMS